MALKGVNSCSDIHFTLLHKVVSPAGSCSPPLPRHTASPASQYEQGNCGVTDIAAPLRLAPRPSLAAGYKRV